jgi:hypothetical protein
MEVHLHRTEVQVRAAMVLVETTMAPQILEARLRRIHPIPDIPILMGLLRRMACPTECRPTHQTCPLVPTTTVAIAILSVPTGPKAARHHYSASELSMEMWRKAIIMTCRRLPISFVDPTAIRALTVP